MKGIILTLSFLLTIAYKSSLAQTDGVTKAISDSAKTVIDKAGTKSIDTLQAEALRLQQLSIQLEKAFRQHFIELTRNEGPDAALEKFQALPVGSYLFKTKARNDMEAIVDSMVLCKKHLYSLTLNPGQSVSVDEKLDNIQEFAEYLQDAINRGEIAERSRLDRIIDNVDYDERSYQSALRKAKTEKEIYNISDERIAAIRTKERAELNKILLKAAFAEATRLVTLRFYEQVGERVPRDSLKIK